MERVGSRSIVVWVVLLLVWGSLASWAEAQPPVAAPEARLARRFADIEFELKRLERVGRGVDAAPLAAELAQLRKAAAGEYRPAASDQTEVHLVGLQNGATPPPGLVTGPDRFTQGYAVVRVTYTQAPVILALTSNQPVHWQIEVAEGVKLKAVALSGHMRNSISGVPAETLLYECTNQSRPEEAFQAQAWGGYDYPEFVKRMGWLTGCLLRTAQYADRYPGQPIVVGPENVAWRQQHILPAAELLAHRASEFDRRDRFAKVADLRFEGVFYTARSFNPHGYYGHGDYAASTAEFTAAGPIESTMRPLDPNVRQVVYDPKENTRFALNQGGELVVYNPLTEEQQQPVPLGGDLVNGFQISAIAFDPLRRRVVAAERHPPVRLAAYRLEDAQWEVLGPLEQGLAGLIYLPEHDQLVGVTMYERHQAEQDEHLAANPDSGQPASPGPAILRIDAQGKVVDTIRPSLRLGATFEEPRGTSLALAKGYLVLQPPPKRGAWDTAEHPLVILDLATRDAVYSGRMRPHDGQGLPPVEEAKEASPTGGGGLGRLLKQIEHAAGGVELLRSNGKTKEAEAYAEKLARYRSRLPGQPGPATDQPELHAVCVGRAHGTVVQVTYQAAPIVLVLCGHETAEWTLRVAPGVRLQKVIVGGQARQRVEGLPDRVPIESYTIVEQSPNAFQLGASDANEESEQAFEVLERITGLRPTTFQAMPMRPRGPLIVGPEGAGWCAKLNERALADLVDDLPAPRNARRERLERVEFPALWTTAVAGQQFGIMRGGPQASLEWATFTPRGPLGDTLVSLPGDLEQVAVDPRGPVFYGVRGNEVLRVDPASGQAEALVVDAGVPALNPPLAIALDTKRRRLVVSSSHQSCWLGYDLEQKTWSLLGRPGNQIFALTYAPSEDAFYAFTENHGPFGSGCVKYNPFGAQLARYDMAQPGLGYRGRGRYRMPRYAYFRHHGARWQLAHADGLLFVVRSASGQYPPRPGRAMGGIEIDAFDPATGETIEFGPAKVHPGFKGLPAGEFDSVWTALGEEDAGLAQKAVWRLAAGGDAAVAEIDRRLTAPPAVDHAQVGKLIEQLDARQAEARKAAFAELSELGGAIAADLEAAAKHPSAEVRSQIRRLQKNAQELLPATPRARQELGAMAVLELIGSGAARGVLERVAGQDSQQPRTRAARQSLDRLDGKATDQVEGAGPQ